MRCTRHGSAHTQAPLLAELVCWYARSLACSAQQHGSMVIIHCWFDELGCCWVVTDSGDAFRAIEHASLRDAQHEVSDRASYYELADYKVRVVEAAS